MLTFLFVSHLYLTNSNQNRKYLGGKIDHAHHATNAKRAVYETLELDKAVSKAKQMTSEDDTLIVVTADHSHVMTMAG
jgi:alkaline phosphatase